MLATLLVLAPLFSDLPKAVLGAVIIDAVVFGTIDVRRAAPSLSGDAIRLLDCNGGHHRRALGGGPCRCCGRGRPLARLARLRRDEAARSRCWADKPGPRSSAISTRTPPTRRSRALPSYAWMAACSSQPPRRSRIASASSPRTGRSPRSRTRSRGGQLHRLPRRRAKVTEVHNLADADGVTLRLTRVEQQVLAVLPSRRDRRAHRGRSHPRQRPSAVKEQLATQPLAPR